MRAVCKAEADGHSRAEPALRCRAVQGMKLSKKEQRELEYKRRVYELAKQRKATEDALQQRDEYHLPDSYDAEGQRSQRYEVLTARYRCAAALGGYLLPQIAAMPFAACAGLSRCARLDAGVQASEGAVQNGILHAVSLHACVAPHLFPYLGAVQRGGEDASLAQAVEALRNVLFHAQCCPAFMACVA